ncbi:MAG: glucokinase, partial [Candidatus Binatia bacterium]
MILAGDIGGTKTYLGLFDWKQDRVDPIREEKFWNVDFKSFEDILTEFLTPRKQETENPETIDEEAAAQPDKESQASMEEPIEAACFGVAGPVVDNRCRATNLPWVIDGHTLSQHLKTPKVRLLNDLEAMAYGVLVLKPEETEVLNYNREPRASNRDGTKALLAAGTGLGEAILFWDGHQYHPLPSEGGHASFAPNSDMEI